MAEKKNYLDNGELKNEILKCISEGYDKAIRNGYKSQSQEFENQEALQQAINLGYVPERSEWISRVREWDPEDELFASDMTPEELESYAIQMEKPIVSDKLGRMFQLIVDNVSRSFYWANPDDGLDCKANALLDLCSNFWKFEPADPGTGKPFSAFAFCTQIAYFGIAGAHRILHPKKYDGTISMSCLDENGKAFELYNL